MSHSDEDEKTVILSRWAALLVSELGIEGVPLDIDEVLALAGDAAHGVLRPAAPLTTYLVGYRAGLAAGRGDDPSAALAEANDAARALAAGWSAGPE